MIKFYDEKHKARFVSTLKQMKNDDPYHQAAAYLIALADLTNVFDYENDAILVEGLDQAWQTSSTRKATRLMFNLWNGHCRDNDEISSYYAVDEIFSNAEYAPYFWEAVKIRFEMV